MLHLISFHLYYFPNSGVWGNNTNENLEVVDAAIGGYLSKSVAGSANVTLTTANQ